MIHHLALGCLNLKRMLAFYESFTDFSLLEKHRFSDGSLRSIWLQSDGVILMLELIEQKQLLEASNDQGLFLMAVPLRDEPQLRRQLSQAEIPIESESDYSLYIRDPEGNRLAFSSYPVPRAESE